jgi:hypothetical protein
MERIARLSSMLNGLDYYHRLEREHVHIKILEDAVRGLDDVNAGRVISGAKLKARYGR